jgi:allantoinase
MHWDHIIRNGRIVTPHELYEADIYMKDGKIAAISKDTLEGSADEVTDAAGKYILPGLMDTHVHSRDPGATHKEDFYHSTQAAAAGGITTLFEMPNVNPPINNAENFYRQVENLQKKAHVNFGIWGICLGRLNLNDIQALNEAGVIGFKYFWGYAINMEPFQLIYNYSPDMAHVFPPSDDGEVFEMFEEVAKTGKIFAIHAENNNVVNLLTKRMLESGRNDYEALLEGRPNLAEELTIQTGISFAKKTGARLHILHVSTGEGVDLISQAQKEGYPITAETCPHYLYLSNVDYDRVGPVMKIFPLVKYKKDQERIWKGISEGVITSVCSDHAPHTEEEKDGDLWSIPAGMCGVETLVPLMLDAVSNKRMTIQDVAALLSENPAKQFGIYPQKGAIQVGSDADMTIVDMNKEMEIKRENLHSKSKITAFDGYKVTGVPVATIVGGTTVMKDGQIVSGPVGSLVTPNK